MGPFGPKAEIVLRLDDLRGRRKQAKQGARSLLALKDPESEFVQSQLKRIHGEIKSLDAAIKNLESSNETAGQIEYESFDPQNHASKTRGSSTVARNNLHDRVGKCGQADALHSGRA